MEEDENKKIEINYSNPIQLNIVLNRFINLGDKNKVKKMLTKVANPNIVDNNGRNSLHLAIENKNSNPEIIKILLENKADPNLMDKYGNTPLHLIAWKNDHNLELIKCFIENGANVNIADKVYGKTSLHISCVKQNPSFETISYLLEKGAETNQKDNFGKTSLHVAAENKSNTIQMIEKLLEKGADTKLVDENGRTSLHLACLNPKQDKDIVKLLLENGNVLNLRDKEGRTCLHCVTLNRNIKIEVLKLLLDYGADVVTKDTNKSSPLKCACWNINASVDIIKLLIDKGAKNLKIVFETNFSVERGGNRILIKDDIIHFFGGELTRNYLEGFGSITSFTKENEKMFWEGEWKNGKKWNGKGTCFWYQQENQDSIYVGEIKEMNPHGKGSFFIFQLEKDQPRKLISTETVNLKYFKHSKISKGTLIRNGKEYYVEFVNGKETKTERSFNGMRLMIIGNFNVGKSFFKERLIYSFDELKTKKILQHYEKKGLERSLQVNTELWRDDDHHSLFTVWDCPGEEEQFVSNSFFFSPFGVYILVFDCSLEIEQIVSHNKLLEYFFLLQTIVGDVQIILLGSKFDILKQKIGAFAFNFENKVRQRLSDINKEINKTLLDNNIKLKFHKFNESFEKQDFLFFPINNKEQDAEKSGISFIYKIICENYDNIENKITTSLAHKLVFDFVNEISHNETQVGHSKIINFFTLKEEIEKLQQVEEFCLDEKIENVLVDLHKIGLLVYLDFKGLNEFIICNINWFSIIIKMLFHTGRKKIQEIIEKVNIKLKQIVDKEKKRKNKNVFIAEQFSATLLEKIKGKVSKIVSIEEIWRKIELRNKSNVDKINFRVLVNSFKKLERKLKLEKITQKIMEEICLNNKNVFQEINLITKEEIFDLLSVFGEEKNVDIIIRYFIHFGIISLSSNKNQNLEKKTFLVPFFFNTKKNKKIKNDGKDVDNDSLLSFKEIGMEQKRLSFECKLKYEIPFSVSFVWKFLFCNIRDCIVSSHNKNISLLNEFYFLDGFFLYFEEFDFLEKKKNNLPSFPTFLKVRINSFKERNSYKQTQTIRIKITSPFNVEKMSFQLRQCISQFISVWIIPSVSEHIKIRTTIKSIKENRPVNLIAN